MRRLGGISIVVLVSIVAACLDEPPSPSPPAAHVVASWDPLACGDPHRVVVELSDGSDAELAMSAPCPIGSLALDAPHFGTYVGRIYAYAPGMADRSVSPVELVVDQPVVDWRVATPP